MARKATRSRVERSAQCRSSMTSSSGARTASRSTTPSSSSNSRPWRASMAAAPAAALPPQARSGTRRARSAPAGPATASSSAGSRSRARPRSAWVTGANGRPSSPSGTQPPRSTRTPCSLAVTASWSASRVLPTPASPPIAVTSGSPLAARASNSRSSASSSLRPTKRPVMTWYAMTPSMPPAPTVVAMRLRVEVWSTVLRSWPGPAPTTSCCEVASRLARYPPVSTSRTAASFHSVSAHSASGSEPATMPFPVTRRAPPAVRVAQRMATAHSPSPRASTQPTGPA